MLSSTEIVFSSSPSVAFRSSFTHGLLLDLDSYGGNDPKAMCLLFYKHVA